MAIGPLPFGGFNSPPFAFPNPGQPVAQPPGPLAHPGGKLGLTPRDHLQEPGSLVVVDDFMPSQPPFLGIGGLGGVPVLPADPPHGELVASSARDAGFAGRVINSPLDDPFAPLNSGDRQMTEARVLLNQPNLAPETTRQAILDRVVGTRVGMLDRLSERLEGLREAGLRDSAVNLSQGESLAGTVSFLYNDVAGAWQGPPEMRQFFRPRLENYARAFNLDPERLMSEDKQVSGPERARLQQALVGSVRQAHAEPASQAAVKRYDQAVRELEAGNNSVVVAAANHQQVAEDLRQDAHGWDIVWPENALNNVLANRDVTTVGATGEGDQVAAYSSQYSEVDVYASGRVNGPNGQPYDGTSFAAPRTAAVLAAVHGQQRGLSSPEAERRLRQQATRTHSSGLPALDAERARQYMQQRTF